MDYSKLKVPELKTECIKLGLPSTGTKAVLIQRLKDNSGVSDIHLSTTTSKKRKIKDESKSTPSTKKAKKVKKDDHCFATGEVYIEDDETFATMLNQTNISQNNNKFYVIQLIHGLGNNFSVFTRWGRVGETGQSGTSNFTSASAAKAEFEKKFKSKTGNNWSARDSFVPKSGKYIMLDMADDEEDDIDEDTITQKLIVDGKKQKVKASALPKETQNLIELIFSNDMFKNTLKEYDIDVKKMPLGKISQTQIQKGMAVLEEIKTSFDNNKGRKDLELLTSQFYSIIPHSFGRNVPPVIGSLEMLQKKVDLLNVLSDIEIAQGMKESGEKYSNTQEEEEIEEIDNPLDINYKQLCNDIKPLEKNGEEYSMIEKYIHATSPKLKVKHLYTIDRETEKERFDEHSNLGNRKLLWHGTNVAVVCAILKTGLRIMPHSGGRVGRGLYFASENDKSAGYVGTSGENLGIMFLNEVALGEEYHITQDDSSLRCAPKGYDSVVAQGRTEPVKSGDVIIQGEYGDIIVPVVISHKLNI
eukprot:gene11102-3809_t